MTFRTTLFVGLLGFVAPLVCAPVESAAQTGDNVLVVVNTNSTASTTIANHYVRVRRVPETNVVRIKTSENEAITRAEFSASIEGPIASWLERHRLQDQVLYLVLTKGVPLRIDGIGGLSGAVASVDSELALLYRRLVGAPVSLVSQIDNANVFEGVDEVTRFSRSNSRYLVTTLANADSELTLLGRRAVGAVVPVVGRIDNPYFLGDKPVKTAARFSRHTSDIYLVTRLDGFTVDDVIALIDRGANPVRSGQVILDQKAIGVDQGGDAWLAQTAQRLAFMTPSVPVQLDTTRALAAATGPVLGYFSWGSNDPANQLRKTGLHFVNGAIGGLFVSTDGRTFREPPASWRPAIAGSSTGGQSLVGDLIRDGMTGVAGYVSEPYLDAVVRPQVLFPAYFSGFNLAESFYLAMPYLSWQGIVIGDPLCSPFEQAPLTAAEIHKGLDAETDLPALFAERRLALLKSSDLKVEALKLYLKAISAGVRGLSYAQIRDLLAKAIVIEPRFTVAHLELAQDADARGDIEGAIVRYRSVVALEPDNAIALNNLAYILVEKKNAAAEALPLAERAYRLSSQAPAVADTLAWAHFKAGNAAAALPYADRAARLDPRNMETLIHTAIIHASLNDPVQARILLDAAVKLDPKAADRADVKELRERIK